MKKKTAHEKSRGLYFGRVSFSGIGGAESKERRSPRQSADIENAVYNRNEGGNPASSEMARNPF